MKIGKVPENVLKRSVFRQIRNRCEGVDSGAGAGRDFCGFSLAEKERMVSCVQEAPIAIEEEEFCCQDRTEVFMTIRELILKCVNNLAAGGAKPVAVLLVLMLPAHTEEAQIRAIMGKAEETCRELSMEIAGGQTRITGAVNWPLAVVTGFAKAPETECHIRKTAEPGQDILLSKWIGLQGTAVTAKRNHQKLLERYPSYLVEEAEGFGRYLSVLPEAEAAVRAGVSAMHDASEGGILGALWELAEAAGCGLEVDMRKLPLRQETVEVCECCNVNPYELLSGGCLVMTAWDGNRLAAALAAEGIPAAVVGKVTEGNERILVNRDEIRYLDRPQRDEIYART